MTDWIPDRDRLESLPVVGPVFAAGGQMLVFDLLVLLGPVVLLVIGLLGRTAVTTALAVAYLLAFLGAVVRMARRGARGE